MWLLHPITVHSFFMAATPSVLPCISGTDCKNGYREGRLVLMFCSHKGKWLFVTRDVGPPWQVSVCIAGRAWTALQSSLRWQSTSLPACCQTATLGMLLSSGKEDTQGAAETPAGALPAIVSKQNMAENVNSSGWVVLCG